MGIALHKRESAIADLTEIVDYLAERSESAANRFIDAVEYEFSVLRDFPLFGSIYESAPTRLAGLRSWPIKGFENYLIFYIPHDSQIEVIRVLHGNRHVARLITDT